MGLKMGTQAQLERGAAAGGAHAAMVLLRPF
jgi:hypothetical protein